MRTTWTLLATLALGDATLTDETIMAKLTENGLLDWYESHVMTDGCVYNDCRDSFLPAQQLRFVRSQATYEEVDALVRAFSPKTCIIIAALSVTNPDSIIVELNL